MTSTVTEICTFLFTNFNHVKLAGTDSYVSLNDLLFTLFVNVGQDQSDLQISNVQLSISNKKCYVIGPTQRIARLMITQFNNFLKYLEKNESPERAIPLLNDFSIRFGQDLLRLRELLFSKSALEVRLRHIESECNVVKTVFVCKQILSRARQVRETEADDDTLTKRLRVGAQLLPPLQKAKLTLEPFFLRDPNMLGEILTEIGLIHLQLFQDFDEAEKTLKEAKKLDDFLDRNIVISANDEHEVCGHALSAR